MQGVLFILDAQDLLQMQSINGLHMHSKTDASEFLAYVPCIEDTSASTVHVQCSWFMQVQQLFALNYWQLTTFAKFLSSFLDIISRREERVKATLATFH